MLLSELIERLEDAVPAVDSVPTADQYDRAIKDAVMDFSRRCGLKKVATLNVNAGTASYSLASDFMKLIMLESFASADGVLISASGLIPVSADWQETYTIANGVITFYPTPTYTMARDYSYAAKWNLTAVDEEYEAYEYAALGEEEAQIVLLKAQAIALTKQINASSGSVLKYSLGAVSVDKSTDVDTKASRSNRLEREYLDACDVYNGRAIMAGGL